jgi:hypothetical protein
MIAFINITSRQRHVFVQAPVLYAVSFGKSTQRPCQLSKPWPITCYCQHLASARAVVASPILAGHEILITLWWKCAYNFPWPHEGTLISLERADRRSRLERADKFNVESSCSLPIHTNHDVRMRVEEKVDRQDLPWKLSHSGLKKFPNFMKPQEFIAVFTKTCQWTLSWAS